MEEREQKHAAVDLLDHDLEEGEKENYISECANPTTVRDFPLKKEIN